MKNEHWKLKISSIPLGKAGMAKRSIADNDCKQAKIASLSPVLKLQLALSTTICPFSDWIDSLSGRRACPPTKAPLWAIAFERKIRLYVYFQHKYKSNLILYTLRKKSRRSRSKHMMKYTPWTSTFPH